MESPPGFRSVDVNVIINRLPGLPAQFEPDGTPGFLLTYRGAVDCGAVWSNVFEISEMYRRATRSAFFSRMRR